MDTLFWACVLRFVQVVILASFWIAAGCLIAGIFRCMIGPAKLRKLFGEGTGRGLFWGWLMGMLLPVCSLGVIPVAREMHRAGIKGGTIIAFALTAPLFNPLSVLFGLTLSDPVAILVFTLCSLLIVSVVGCVFDRLFPTATALPPADEAVAHGLKRIIAVFVTAVRELTGPSALFMLLGIAGSVLMCVLLPHGSLSTSLERSNGLAPLQVALLATPIYSTPLLAMSQIGSMFQHGNSIGASFSLLILGCGVNIGLIAWFGSVLGWRQTATFFVLLGSITVGLAYLISEPLYPQGVQAAGHTHAFDIYTNPFHPGISNPAAVTVQEINKFWINQEFGGTTILGLMLVGGLLVRISGRKFDWDAWLQAGADRKLKYDAVVPDAVLGWVAFAGLAALSIAGCFLYYPAPKDTLADMSIFNGELVVSARGGHWESAMKWIDFQNDLSRRLEVGTFLRQGTISEFHQIKARILREELELLKHEVEDQELDDATAQSQRVDTAFRRLQRAFQE